MKDITIEIEYVDAEFLSCVKRFGFNTAADMIMTMVRCMTIYNYVLRLPRETLQLGSNTSMPKSYVRMFEVYIYIYNGGQRYN